MGKKKHFSRKFYTLLKSALIFVSGVLVTIFFEKLTDKIHFFSSKNKWEAKILTINVKTDSSLIYEVGKLKEFSNFSKIAILDIAEGNSVIDSPIQRINYSEFPDEYDKQNHLYISYQVLLYIKNSSEKSRNLEEIALSADSVNYYYDTVFNIPNRLNMTRLVIYYSSRLVEGLKEMRGNAPINFNPDETKLVLLDIIINIHPELERQLIKFYGSVEKVQTKSIKEIIAATNLKSGWGAKPKQNLLTLKILSNMGQKKDTLNFSLYNCEFWNQMQ